jgi:hypothetical protein
MVAFILGEAVDEAASHYERADAAIVWLAPSALSGWHAEHLLQADQWTMIHDAVPLKGGSQFRTLAVDPFDPSDSPEERRGMSGLVLGTFDRDGGGRTFPFR